MPNLTTRIGVPTVELSVDSTVAVPNCTALTFTASGVTPTELLNNDVNTALLSTDTYQVIVGLIGRDVTNGGYTVLPTSPSSGSLTVSSGQIIEVKVTTANWPSNFEKAVCAVIFLKTNSGNFQLCQFNYIDPNDTFFTAAIMSKPLRAAASFTQALLMSGTSDSTLGSRWGLGFTYFTFPLTTGTFNFRRPVTNVTVSPNSGADFVVTTTRSVGIRFESLVNDIKAFVQAAAGTYVEYVSGSSTFKQAQASLNTAVALFRGNRPVRVTMPPDNNGSQEIRLLVGLLTTNQTELSEAWSKSGTTPVPFQFDPAPLDILITNAHCEINYLKVSS